MKRSSQSEIAIWANEIVEYMAENYSDPFYGDVNAKVMSKLKECGVPKSHKDTEMTLYRLVCQGLRKRGVKIWS